MNRFFRRSRGMASYQTVLIVCVFAMIAHTIWQTYQNNIQTLFRNTMALQLGPVDAGLRP